MKLNKIVIILLLAFFLIGPNVYAKNIIDVSNKKIDTNSDSLKWIYNFSDVNDNEKDIDPTVDLKIKVNIKEIRALEKIDLIGKADFYVKVIINSEDVYTSKVWKNKDHVDELWSTPYINVPDDKEWVNVTIQLWDKNPGLDKLCDIANNDNANPLRREINVIYNLKTGHWIGDDAISADQLWGEHDYSGYGRANGCDDNSIYDKDLDCELFFDIVQNDYDNDSIPYWTEVNVFGTDPLVDDTGRDDDHDGVPIEWEYKWGYRLGINYTAYTYYYFWEYDPFIYDDFEKMDPDRDSINNYEEYLTSDLGSDPFRKDVFIELDQMQAGPNGEPASLLPDESKELMKKAFDRQNIVLHIDDGKWAKTGSDMIPFDNETSAERMPGGNELDQIYNDYFVNSPDFEWKRGIFHYGVVIYQSSVVNGNAFGPNRFQISAKGVLEKSKPPFPIAGNKDVCFASAYMHELGHTLNLEWLLGHDKNAYYPWQPLWWISRPYRSIMNYGYMYGGLCNLVDYSDGSRGFLDHDDWDNIDYDYFEGEYN